MEQINLQDWEVFSQRIYSSSYKSKDGRYMLKTATKDENAINTLKAEYEIASMACSLGIPTPKVYSFVQVGPEDLPGIIYENINDKISFSRALAKEPEKLEILAKEFAEVIKKFHSIEADTTKLPSFESRVRDGLANTKIFTEKEKESLLERLEEMPKGTKCLHGDLQFSNAISSPMGNYIIDLSTMSYGNPLFDVGYIYHLATYMPDETIQAIFHINKETFNKAWRFVVKYYFDTDNIDDFIEMIKPYAKFGTLPILCLVPDADSVIFAKDFILTK